MKKLLAFLLAIILVMPCMMVKAEEEDRTYYKVEFDVGEGAVSKIVLIEGDEIYLASDDYADLTRYESSEEGRLFLIKGQKINNQFKKIIVNVDTGKAEVSGFATGGRTEVALDGFIYVEDKLYLPLSQMLPMLDAQIYKVENNVVYIANNPISLAEVLADFDMENYYFNFAKEFDNNVFWATGFFVPNYIYNTITDLRYDRLDIVYESGNYEDYKEIFSQFVLEDNQYLKTIAQDENAVDKIVDLFHALDGSAKKINSVCDWIETAGKSDASLEMGGALLQELQEYYDSGELDSDDLRGLTEAWTGGKISFSDAFELSSYIYRYHTQAEDSRKMINAVYDLYSTFYTQDVQRKAAKYVYDMYSENVLPAMLEEISNKLIEVIEKELLKPWDIYMVTTKLVGDILEMGMGFSPSDISKLPLYCSVAETAKNSFYSYDTVTDESTDNMRLSLLLCLMASKKCYSIMEETAIASNVDGSYYSRKMEDCDRLMMGLYLAAENVELDSFEHYNENRELNLQKIKPIIQNPVEVPKEREMASFIGKNINELIEELGLDYIIDYFAGGPIIVFTDVPAWFFYNTDTGIVNSILCHSNVLVGDGIRANLNFSQLSSDFGVTELKSYYNLMDDVQVYSARVEKEDYKIYFEWTKDPYTDSPDTVSVSTKESNTGSSGANPLQVINKDHNVAGKTLEFSEIPRSFYFSSGAGAWGTSFELNEDGSFTGSFHDSNMGDMEASYPHGTIYYCNFSGKFGKPQQVNKYTYKMKLESFSVEQPASKEIIADGFRQIFSDPYGFDGATEYYLYLPGINHTIMLPQSCYNWARVSYGYNLDSYIICSEKGELPFIAYPQ